MKSPLFLSSLFIVVLCFIISKLSAQNINRDSSSAKAQKTTSGGIYLGIGALPYGNGLSGDLTLEALGGVTPASNFLLGFRFQIGGTPNVGYTSICIASDYYIYRPKSGLRVFAGAGIGGFNPFTRATAFGDYFFDLNDSNFGFLSRIGIEAGHFRLSGEYNFTGGINNYAAVNIGYFF